MGSSEHGGDLILVTVSTENLREKLNRIYDAIRSRPGAFLGTGLFEYLWDLKELALLEGRNSVQVPDSWLQELDADVERVSREAARSH